MDEVAFDNEDGEKEFVKKGLGRNVGRYIFMSVVIFLFLFAIYFFWSEDVVFDVEGVSKCGDGTFDGKCSLTYPYYCSNSVLIKDSISCGCSDVEFNNEELFSKSDGKCETDYFNSDTEVYYEYVLDGEKGVVPFYVHSNVVDHVKTIPRQITYLRDEIPRRDEFKLNKIDDVLQKEALMPMVVAIQNLAPESKDMQAKIAVSLVQKIPYGEPEFDDFMGNKIRLSRFPYEVLENNVGSCEGKSELLAFLLRELGFGVSVFYYFEENHEAVGIKCPIEESYMESGYCFVETTVPAPISYSEGVYLGINGGKLESDPEIVLLSKGFSLSSDLQDYEDADKLDSIMSSALGSGSLNVFQQKSYDILKEKYGLNYF